MKVHETHNKWDTLYLKWPIVDVINVRPGPLSVLEDFVAFLFVSNEIVRNNHRS